MTSPSSINYEELMHNLRLSLVKDVLTLTAKHGLIGQHHFTIAVNTQDNAIVMPPYILEQYPSEMVIILQHRFENLSLSEDSFSVTLYFQGKPERITVPWSAVMIFQDPSVPFGLLIRQPSEEPRQPSNISSHNPTTDKAKKIIDNTTPTKKNKEKGQVIAFNPHRNTKKTSHPSSPPPPPDEPHTE
jgi:hypothetical protein